MSQYDSSRFWVIFDTCTHQEYYQDVHNLLALPRGAIIQYTYRQRLLSDEAQQAGLIASGAPQQALLIYGQRSTFKHGDPDQQGIFSDMLWIPTRLGEIQQITPSGESYNFYIKVASYPKTNATSQQRLLQILNPLIQVQDVPYCKWVAISDGVEALAHISDDNDEGNWQGIVSELSKPPVQFSTDKFWRLDGLYPYNKDTGHVVEPRYKPRTQTIYDLSEGRSYELKMHSYTAWGKEDMPNHKVEIKSNDEQILRVILSTPCRPYGEFSVRIAAQRSDIVNSRPVSLSIRTEPRNNGWPIGPEFNLAFLVKKRLWKVLFGIVLGLVGSIIVTLIAIATKFLDTAGLLRGEVSSIVIIITIFVVCELLAFLGMNLVLSSKLSFKPC